MTERTCPKCGYIRKPSDSSPDFECPGCGIIYDKYRPEDDIHARIDAAKRSGDWSNVPRSVALSIHDRIIISTTPMIPGMKVDEVIEVISSEVAYGMGFLRDWFASLTDVLGGESKATQNVLRDLRRQVIKELRKEAFNVGADAVIGVNLSYSEFSGGGKSMLFLVASGTAVRASRL